MYQPSTPWGAKAERCAGVSWTRMRVPGGAKGVALKLKFPKRAACAESFGWRRDERRRLSVSVAWSMSRSHSVKGNLGSQVARPARK
jgi:hypothetical protein